MLSDGTYNPITTTEIAGASTESQSKQNQDKSEIQSVKNRLQTNYALFKRTPSHSPRVVALPPNSNLLIHLCMAIRHDFPLSLSIALTLSPSLDSDSTFT